MSKNINKIVIIAFAAMLSACGGGGSSDASIDSTPSVNTAEGLWFSDSIANLNTRMLITSEGKTFGFSILSTSPTNAEFAAGAKRIRSIFVGQSNGVDDKFSGAVSVWADRTPVTTFDPEKFEDATSGTVEAGKEINFSNNTTQSKYTYSTSYDNEITVGDFEGDFIGRLRTVNDSKMNEREFAFHPTSPTTGVIAINSNGEFTRTVGNCILRGNITTNTFKKGYLDLTATATGCDSLSASTPFKGVAMINSNGVLALIAFNDNNTSGFVILAFKQQPV